MSKITDPHEAHEQAYDAWYEAENKAYALGVTGEDGNDPFMGTFQEWLRDCASEPPMLSDFYDAAAEAAREVRMGVR